MNVTSFASHLTFFFFLRTVDRLKEIYTVICMYYTWYTGTLEAPLLSLLLIAPRLDKIEDSKTDVNNHVVLCITNMENTEILLISPIQIHSECILKTRVLIQLPPRFW